MRSDNPSTVGSGSGNTAMLAAFAVHNAEEIAFLGKLPPFDFSRLQRLGLTPEVYRRDRMAIATGLLSAVVTAFTRSGTNTRYAVNTRSGLTGAGAAQFLDVAATGALAGNAVGHLAAAVVTGKYNPGLATAPLLLAGAVRHLRLGSKTGALRTPAVIAGVVTGNVLSIPAIVASLLIAKRLTPGEPTGR
jgi:hypothetical protein